MREETVTYLSFGEVGLYGDRPLQRVLGKGNAVQTWVWPLGSSLQAAVAQVGAIAADTHVVGHGAAAGLALAVAAHVPVRSVAVMGVGAYSGLDWRAYAQQRLAIPCGRWVTLARLARWFFGVADWSPCRALALLLDRDLGTHVPVAGEDWIWGKALPAVPVWVGGAADDPVVLPRDYEGWRARLREGDRWGMLPTGGHFFHYHHPVVVANELQKFWQEIAQSINVRELKHDTREDRSFGAGAGTAELRGFAIGASGKPSARGNGTPARGGVVADRRGMVASHHLG
ncbi:MAG: hypothetical protein ACUVSQ_12440 [Pseudanabaenaceae cyanobacterium]